MASRSSEEKASSMHIKSACNARPEGNQRPEVMSDYTPMQAALTVVEKLPNEHLGSKVIEPCAQAATHPTRKNSWLARGIIFK